LNKYILLLLYQIIVTDLRDPNTKYTGICNKWLAKDEDDKQIVRELILTKETTQTKKSKKY
jgi:hypothetical protein